MNLFEVIIAFFILSLILLGLDAALLYSLRYSKATYYAELASLQINNLIERMKLNNEKPTVELLEIWNQENHEVIPNGHGTLSYQYPTIIISLFWGKYSSTICEKNKIDQSGCLRHVFEIANLK